MTQDEIIKMAVQAGIAKDIVDIDIMERFAKLVAQHEREACAKLCESEGIRIDASYLTCAEFIRARGQA
jgi:uncharacterized protein YutE (UPF0331/DUF86 family)